MKRKIIRCGLLLLAGICILAEVNAQRNPRKRNTDQPANTGQQPSQQNNNNQPSVYNPYGNIPIRVDSSGMADTVIKKSLRPDDAFDKSEITNRTPLPYENLRWDDALFAEKVWRELDLREKINKVFTYEGQDDNGSQVFVEILLNAVKKGEVTAFKDDRFTTPMSLDELFLQTVGTADTVAVTDPNDINKVMEYRVTRASFDPKSVLKLAIKEEWIFDREASRMFVRILGIAPLQTKYLPNGQERGVSPLFYVYYPDLRPLLSKREVYNPKNMGTGRMTWEELFESRMFSSYIVKSTFDNPGNKPIRSYIKSNGIGNENILALLEGDNIKEKIFNYEQDLWSY